MSDLNFETELPASASDADCLPVGSTGMYARRGEVLPKPQTIKASLLPCRPCRRSIEEVAPKIERPNVVPTLRTKRSWLHEERIGTCASGRRDDTGLHGGWRQYPALVTVTCTQEWAVKRKFVVYFNSCVILVVDVGLTSASHTILGKYSYLPGSPTKLEDYIGWLGDNFDPSISWSTPEWIRDLGRPNGHQRHSWWRRCKSIAVRFGADGIVVSNHGGRQLDGVLSSAKATACHDCRRGKRRHQDVSGRLWHSYRLDVVRMMAMGADCTLLLVALLSTRVSSVSDKQVLRTCSTFTTRDARCDDLTGAKTIKDLTRDSLVWPD